MPRIRLTDDKGNSRAVGTLVATIWGFSLYDGNKITEDKLIASADINHKDDLYKLAGSLHMDVIEPQP
jgi:hypothetical protein